MRQHPISHVTIFTADQLDLRSKSLMLFGSVHSCNIPEMFLKMVKTVNAVIQLWMNRHNQPMLKYFVGIFLVSIY